MYSELIKDKVDLLFNELKSKATTIVSESSSSKEATEKVTRLVSSELAARSKSILSDMLFDLTDKLMETEYFSDISKQNRFTEVNLRQEILNKYQFASGSSLDFDEAAQTIQALMAGGATLVVGGAAEVGYVLISGLELSVLVPIPISVLIVASIGVALADYYANWPRRSKKALKNALDTYLDETNKQYIEWFDEVEKYFNSRVEEIKKTI